MEKILVTTDGSGVVQIAWYLVTVQKYIQDRM